MTIPIGVNQNSGRLNGLHAESVLKATARGVEIEIRPPSTCHLPLATIRYIPGFWLHSPHDALQLSVRSTTKLKPNNRLRHLRRAKTAP